MTLEEEIKSKFKNQHHKLLINLMFTNNWICDQQMQLFKPFDLTSQQYNVLRILRGQYPNTIRVNDIIGRMLDKMSNVSRLVDKLYAKELLSRTICPSDRRAANVIITQKGLDLLAQIDGVQDNWEKTLHILTPQEAQTLNDLMDKLRGK